MNQTSNSQISSYEFPLFSVHFKSNKQSLHKKELCFNEKGFCFDKLLENQKCIITINFIHFRAEPDLEFEGLLKRQHTRVKYFQGSLMNAMDLERSKVTRGLQFLEFARFRFLPICIHSNLAFAFS